MAFGTSRHRAWDAGVRPRGWQTGSRGRRLGGVREADFEHFGGLLGVSWEVFCGASRSSLRACRGLLGATGRWFGVEGSTCPSRFPLWTPSWEGFREGESMPHADESQ
eukprot:7007115-Pyramimonas_sp.AAC.1